MALERHTNGRTPLHEAAERGSTEHARRALAGDLGAASLEARYGELTEESTLSDLRRSLF